MSEDKDQLTSHDYDGIQEYNNPLPTWWLWTFLITIIFAFMYYIHYELGGAPSQLESLQASLAIIEEHKANTVAPVLSAEDFAKLIETADLKLAETHFQTKCMACHGVALGGGIGPNLTDGFWLHGKGTPSDIMAVIKNGVLDKGMPAWGALLAENESVALVALILAKQDSQPKDAKAPQGEKVR